MLVLGTQMTRSGLTTVHTESTFLYHLGILDGVHLVHCWGRIYGYSPSDATI
jgi:hypothetical protein